MENDILEFIIKEHPRYIDIVNRFSNGNEEDIKSKMLDLEQNGKIEKIGDKYFLPKELGLQVATIATIKDKYSFASIEDEEDVYIDNANLKNAFVGDIVFVRKISNNYDKNIEYEVYKIIKRTHKEIVGEVAIHNGLKVLIVEKIASLDLQFIIDDQQFNVERKQIIKARIRKVSLRCCIVEPIQLIGNKSDVGVDISRIIIANNAPIAFPNDVIEEVKNIPLDVSLQDKINREDYTDHLIVTIDGDDAKDFDDAVEVSFADDVYYVGVHIADVSHYVKENSSLDKEALNRATSLYVQDRVVPMLPFELSNGICSLNPNVERLAFSCLFAIDIYGNILMSHLCKSVIKSSYRLTYKYVNKFLNEERFIKNNYSSLEEMLIRLKEVSDIIHKKRIEKGSLELESTELEFTLNDKGCPIEIKKRKQDVGEQLIEDLMIKANEIVASTIEKMKLPMIYRIHENPHAKRFELYKKISESKGYPCYVDALNPKSIDVSKYLKTITNKDDYNVLSRLLLRSLAKAKYSITNKKHFGLASDSYTHFTSPIRRYPDLIVHRLLNRYIIDGNLTYSDEFKASLDNKAQLTSQRERRALSIERSVDDLLCAKYMKDKVGNEYDATIVSMIPQGMFAELDNGIQGFISFDSIGGDYYIFDEESYHAFGARKGKRFYLGQKIKVILISVDIEHSKISFGLLDSSRFKYFKKKKGKK